MITAQIASSTDAREKARKALADYLSMFLPGSWQEPMARIKTLLLGNGETDWESLKGHALLLFDERRLSTDRVESLARVERVAETLRELHAMLPPSEWYRGIENVFLAAHFRVSKMSVQTGVLRPREEMQEDDPE
jgi:hypothetical protein